MFSTSIVALITMGFVVVLYCSSIVGYLLFHGVSCMDSLFPSSYATRGSIDHTQYSLEACLSDRTGKRIILAM